AILELDNRRVARLEDEPRAYFDPSFDPARPPDMSFGELADQYLQQVEEDATANGISEKWVDKQKAILALLREMIGSDRAVRSVDYDICLRVRSLLARTPTNRTKIYKGIPLEQAIELAAADNKPRLSAVTQQSYLATLKDVLGLAAKK